MSLDKIKTEIKAHELQALINVVYEAVERSKVGPFFVLDEYGKEVLDPNGSKILNSIAYNSYLSLLSNLVPKNLGGGFKFTEEKIDV